MIFLIFVFSVKNHTTKIDYPRLSQSKNRDYQSDFNLDFVSLKFDENQYFFFTGMFSRGLAADDRGNVYKRWGYIVSATGRNLVAIQGDRKLICGDQREHWRVVDKIRPQWRETIVFYGINEPRKSDRLLDVKQPLETAASETAVIGGNFSPNKRSDFRVAIKSPVFYGLNTASRCGFSSIFFPWVRRDPHERGWEPFERDHSFFRRTPLTIMTDRTRLMTVTVRV